MRTKAEIIKEIEKREEEKRLELVAWAIELIDAATEEMFENLQTKVFRWLSSQQAAKFERATDLPEVKEALQKAEVNWSVNQYAPGEMFCEVIFNLY